MNKRSILILLILVVALCFGLSSCGKSDDGSTTFISLDINPSIELVVDGKNEVVSVYAANEDAQILLYDEDEDLIGEDVEDAVRDITKLAIKLDYITEENSKIGMNITSTLDGKAEALYEELDKVIVKAADKKGIEASTDTKSPYSVVRKLKKLKEQNPDNTDIQALSENTFKLALSAIENNEELTLEDAIKLDNIALVSEIQKSHSNSTNYATSAYEQAKEEALKTYNKGVVLLKEGVYATYYLNPKNLVNHIDTFWYGSVYHMYKIAQSGFKGVGDSMEFVINLTDYPIDEETVNMIASKFNIKDTSVLENANGEITMKSVEGYLDRLIRNADIDTEALEALYDEVLDAVETVSKLKSIEAAKEAAKDLISEAEGVTAVAEKVLEKAMEAFETFSYLLPTAAKAPFIEVKTTFDSVKAELAVSKETGTFSIEQIRTCENKLQSAADTLLLKMTQELGEEKMAELELKKQEFEKDMEKLAKTMEETLETAASNALNEISELNKKRKNK